jgi:hypothetical protein
MPTHINAYIQTHTRLPHSRARPTSMPAPLQKRFDFPQHGLRLPCPLCASCATMGAACRHPRRLAGVRGHTRPRRCVRIGSGSHYDADPCRRYCPCMLGGRPARADACAFADAGGRRTLRRSPLGWAVRASPSEGTQRGCTCAYTRTRARSAPAWRRVPLCAVRPSCGVARRAGGPLRAPLCAGFADGALSTNACPSGFSKIGSAAACAGAAAAVGRPYLGSVTDASAPSGCNTYVTGDGAAYAVGFNTHSTGAPASNLKPLCAGTPAA